MTGSQEGSGFPLRPPAPSRTGPDLTGWVGKVWSAPLTAHAAVLFALMVGVAAFIGTTASYTDDEGAGILQAQLIEHGHWTLANPLPSVDPTAASYPLDEPTYGTKGIAPLGKNLFYFVVLAGLGLALGTAGMVGLSIFGTVAAALLASRLARELGASERTTFWLVGLASPLFFDGFLVVAHSAAAALAAGSALLALRFLRTGGLWRWAGAVVCAGSACLLRTEAVLWALGLGAGALVFALGPRRMPGAARRGLSLAIGTTVLMLIARKANALLVSHAIGSALPPPGGAVPATLSRGSLGDQLHGLILSWFDLGSSSGAVRAVIVSLVVLLAVWARAARLNRSNTRSTLAAAGVVAAFSLYLAVATPHQYAAGMALVFPVLWAGIWLLNRPIMRDPAARLLVLSSTVYALLVTATEYSDAGSWQPGRYFFLAIPAMVPVVVVALAGLLRGLSEATQRATVACVVVGLLVTAASAVSTLHFTHRTDGGMATAVRSVAPDAPPGDGGLPVFITTYPAIPRLEWATFPSVRWQLVSESRLALYGTDLARAGIGRLVLVSLNPDHELTVLSGAYRPVKTVRFSLASAWSLIVLQRATPSDRSLTSAG